MFNINHLQNIAHKSMSDLVLCATNGYYTTEIYLQYRYFAFHVCRCKESYFFLMKNIFKADTDWSTFIMNSACYYSVLIGPGNMI